MAFPYLHVTQPPTSTAIQETSTPGQGTASATAPRPVFCGLQGNRRSGVALVMHATDCGHRQRAQWPKEGRSSPRLCQWVCLSLTLWTVQKTANIPSNVLHHPVASTFWLSHAKRRSEIPTGPPTTSNEDAKRTLPKFGYSRKQVAQLSQRDRAMP